MPLFQAVEPGPSCGVCPINELAALGQSPTSEVVIVENHIGPNSQRVVLFVKPVGEKN
jgi:hypothetical protein